MKTPQELALEHARTYVRNRGWRCEPLSWEEVEVLLKEADLAATLRRWAAMEEAS